MYICEVCNYNWNNKKHKDNSKFVPFRCPRCRENSKKLLIQNRERSKREDFPNLIYRPPECNDPPLEAISTYSEAMEYYWKRCGALNISES